MPTKGKAKRMQVRIMVFPFVFVVVGMVPGCLPRLAGQVTGHHPLWRLRWLRRMRASVWALVA